MGRYEKLELIIENVDKLKALLADTAKRLRDVEGDILWDNIDAAWAALEASDDPSDVAQMKRIRERIRKDKAPQGGNGSSSS